MRLQKEDNTQSNAINDWSLMNGLQKMIHGLRDALALGSMLKLILKHHSIQKRLILSLILNIVIFCGCIVVQYWVLLPCIRQLFGSSLLNQKKQSHFFDSATQSALPSSIGSEGRQWGNQIMNEASRVTEITINVFYQWMLVYPIYWISFILNRIWYQDIADQIVHVLPSHSSPSLELEFRKNRQTTNQSAVAGVSLKKKLGLQTLIALVAEEMYRALLSVGLLVQMLMVKQILVWTGAVSGFLMGPATFLSCSIKQIFELLVGWSSLFQLAMMYAMYAFDYRWSASGVMLEQRLCWMEYHWPYFLGFGLPMALLTWSFPGVLESGLFAFMFPFFIILALSNTIQNYHLSSSSSSSSISVRSPIFPLRLFRLPRKLGFCIVFCFRRVYNLKNKK